MKTVWGINGSSYDGCNGWHSWKRDEVFDSKEKAFQYIRENLGYDSYIRYGVIEIKVG